MNTIPAHVQQHGPWSISKAGVIAKCSLQYDFKYGPNKQPEPPQVVSPESRIGVTVHKALEFALDGIPVKKAFQMAQDQETLTTDELDKVQCFYEQVERFTKRISAFKTRHGVSPLNVFIERKIGISPEFRAVKFFDKTGLFRGVIDFMLITAKKDAIIIDHKSGKQKEMKYFDDQCRAYCILALALVPDLKGVQTAINFVQSDRLEWNPRVTAETIRTEYHPWLIKYLTESTAGLLEAPKPQDGWWCDWCSYKGLCPKQAVKK